MNHSQVLQAQRHSEFGAAAPQPLVAPRRETGKFVLALVAGTVAAFAVDCCLVGRLPTAAAQPAVVAAPVGPLETMAVETLVERASDGDAQVRMRAVDELGRRGAIAQLAALLGNPQDDVRQRVPEALLLSSQAAHDQIPLIAARLESVDPRERTAAAEALLVLVRVHGPYRGPSDVARGPASASR